MDANGGEAGSGPGWLSVAMPGLGWSVAGFSVCALGLWRRSPDGAQRAYMGRDASGSFDTIRHRETSLAGFRYQRAELPTPRSDLMVLAGIPKNSIDPQFTAQ